MLVMQRFVVLRPFHCFAKPEIEPASRQEGLRQMRRGSDAGFRQALALRFSVNPSFA